MPFKLVQTVEKGKPVLTAVPRSWERCGTLFWPRNQADKLLKIEDICPEDNWIPIPCELKKDNLSNYDQAQMEISSMLYRCVGGQERNARNPRNKEPSNSSNNMQSNIVTCFQDPLAPAALSAVMELVLENQRIMLETQNEVMQTIDEYAVKLDSLSAVSTQSGNQCLATRSNQLNIFTPIDNVQELDDFEQDLKDLEQKNALYKKFTAVCQGQGENSPYTLIDMLFTRLFMTKCSWTGGSRAGVKVPFKIYNNTIHLFQQVVHSCDKTFSMLECHKFLKSVLKNSTQRSESKGMKASHRKKRRKRSQMSYMNDVESSDECNESGDCEPSHNSTELPHKKSGKAEMSDGETDTNEAQISNVLESLSK